LISDEKISPQKFQFFVTKTGEDITEDVAWEYIQLE
jgi:hypothetical protein